MIIYLKGSGIKLIYFLITGNIGFQIIMLITVNRISQLLKEALLLRSGRGDTGKEILIILTGKYFSD
jgi:hypothetical protein